MFCLWKEPLVAVVHQQAPKLARYELCAESKFAPGKCSIEQLKFVETETLQLHVDCGKCSHFQLCEGEESR